MQESMLNLRRLEMLQICASLLVALVVLIYGSLHGWAWYWIALAVLGLAGYAGILTMQRKLQDARLLTVIATLAAIASVGRDSVQGIPDVQPATFLILMSGFSFGPTVGAAVGALTAIGSNLILGEGIWTPWQMVAWGGIGLLAGLIRKFWIRFPVWGLILVSVLGAYGFGWFMDIQYVIGEQHLNWHTYLLACMSSFFPFDTTHAGVTAGLVLVAGKPVFRLMERYKQRMEAKTISNRSVQETSQETSQSMK
ncbi:ECF transporter S component [Alicyclobacillus tolerans]|uniref:ECF transporter S component n=1 Tax=Alicyclobacillus tolerans TaxID=90970 RepID=UPI003B7AD5C1